MTAHNRWMGVLCLLGVAVGVATAGELPVTYLTPETFAANLGDSVLLRVQLGEALRAAPTAWPEDQLAWFFVRSGDTAQNRPTVRAVDRDPNAAEVSMPRPGATVVGFDSKPVVAEVLGSELKSFLTKNVAGAADDPAVRGLKAARRLRVRRIQSATTLIRVAAPGAQVVPSVIAMSKTGQKVEIRPLSDPTMVPVGRDLPLRVYVGASKEAGAKVQATSLDGGTTVAATTDSSGAAHFRITHTGQWRIEFHYAEPNVTDADIDWDIRSATLTFEVTKEGAGK